MAFLTLNYSCMAPGSVSQRQAQTRMQRIPKYNKTTIRRPPDV